MAEATEELQDSETPEEEAHEETPEQPEAPSESTEEMVPKSEFDKVFARAKKAEERLKDGRTASDPVENKEAPSAKAEEKAAGITIEQVLQLRNEGYSEGEILNLSSKAKGLGVSVDKLLSDETFKAGIQAEREKAKVESATPAPSTSSPKIGGKTFEEMTDAERKANWDAIISGGGAKSSE